ncbi:MAG: hypothetical protein V7782_02010 [Psychromonas sp.]
MKHHSVVIPLLIMCSSAMATEVEITTEPEVVENASNPLAKVKNVDLRLQHFEDKNDRKQNNWSLEGAFMAADNWKITYEFHYLQTDINGKTEHNPESALLKAIYFAKDGKWGNTPFRVATGADIVVDLGDQDKGIGSGSDLFGPFLGVAFSLNSGQSLIPLVQHYANINGPDVSTTAFRVIMLQPLPDQSWLKIDLKMPVDWAHDNAIPANFEAQYGMSFNNGIGVYADGLVGIGNDRPYDWGLGLGVRFS